MTTLAIAHPPATLEGWYALHQIFRISGKRLVPRELDRMIKAAKAKLGGASKRSSAMSPKRKGKGDLAAGWSCFVSLVGSTSDLMVIHFRDTLDAIGQAQSTLVQTTLARSLEPVPWLIICSGMQKHELTMFRWSCYSSLVPRVNPSLL